MVPTMSGQPSPSSRPSTPRGVGRPSRLSRDLVISTALELLDEIGLESFSIGKLAKRLGASPMSLYTYFPSRDAILEAAADQAFRHFAPPPPGQKWQDFVLAWLHAISDHFKRFPVALKVIAWGEQLSAGWLGAWMPVVRILSEQEADEVRLSRAINWFSHASIGFIQGHVSGPRRIGALPNGTLDGLMEADRALLDTVHRHLDGSDMRWVLDFGFRNIVAGLETLLADARRP